MARVYNFGAGPAALPEPVLERARDEFMDWHGCGMSVLEMSHRGKEFAAIAEKVEADLRDLLGVPEHYRVLFLSGGATAQFAMVPMNLLRGKSRASYVCTGAWSQKAMEEAGRYCGVSVAAVPEGEDFVSIPSRDTWHLDADSAYLHYTANETINGVEFQDVPESGGLPLVSDMSSNLLSRPVDVSRFGLIYACAQKNLGPAGVTVVIVREDLLGDTVSGTPSMFDYAKHAANDSMLNTPPTFNWYMVGLVLEWIRAEGGVEAMQRRARRRADKLYAAIDGSALYRNRVEPGCRSLMNVPFVLADEKLLGPFLAEAEKAGLAALKGHRSVGGVRASIYNAMPEAGVDALIQFMSEFERSRG